MKRRLTEYTFRAAGIEKPLRFAFASDLHSAPFDDLLEEFGRCDAVLFSGDLVDRHRRDNGSALRFLDVAPDYAPVFFSIGNHEEKYRYKEEFLQKVRQSRVTLLDNDSVLFRGVRIGGLSSVREGKPDLAFLDRFEREPGYRLLLCHQPEVYRDYVSGRAVDLTLCGHAHGGQIQVCGRGLYAPGQGLFPKMTHGLYDGGRMLLSRGLTNGAKPRVPRIGNPCELVILNLVLADR